MGPESVHVVDSGSVPHEMWGPNRVEARIHESRPGFGDTMVNGLQGLRLVSGQRPAWAGAATDASPVVGGQARGGAVTLAAETRLGEVRPASSSAMLPSVVAAMAVSASSVKKA